MIHFTLNNGIEIPAVGLGTFRSKDEDAYNAVLHAIKVGYRHIDTAAVYRNEAAVGRAIKDSGVPREELFVTTKIYNGDQGYMNTRRAVVASLEKLGLDYVDLFLIHWPVSYELSRDTYRALEDMHIEGYTRSIGVSNFNFHHLEHLFETAEIMPVVNQVESHVYLQNEKLQDFCMRHGIRLEAYAPFLSHKISELFKDETLQDLAKKYGKTIPQLVLRYQVEREIVVLPKSITPARIEENLDIFGFQLSEEDFKTMHSLNRAWKIFPEADNFSE